MPEEERRARLQERLDQATLVAEQLMARLTAAAQPDEAQRPPAEERRSPQPRDNAKPPPAEERRRRERDPLSQLLELVSVGELVPVELQRRLAEAVRDLLAAVQALVEWYLERLERPGEEPPEVEDIPIL